MNNKRNMYKDQNSSDKKQKKRRWIYSAIIIIILAGLGVAVYGGISVWQRNKNSNSLQAKEVAEEKYGNSQEESLALISPSIRPEPTLAIEPSPTPTPAPEPTQEAMEATTNEMVISQAVPSPTIVKGIYVTAPVTGTNYMDKLIQLVDTTEINAMVIDVKDDHGRVSYLMEDTIAGEIGADSKLIPNIDDFIKQLKEKEIYLIARIVAFKDPYLAEQRQDWAIKNKDGSIYRDNNNEGWVNPYKKEVWDYLAEIASNAAEKGFDEIQFDYIRFSTGKGMSEVDFGAEATGISKEEIITGFTKYIYEKLKPLGVYVSADVYGTIISSAQDAGLVGQNYVEMAKYLDYICPMIYPSHFGKGNYGIENPDLEPYNIIRKVLTASKEKLSQIPEGEHQAIVRPWLQDFTATWIKPHLKYGPDELRAQIEGVYSVGYEEWLLWNAGCKYSEDGLEKASSRQE